MTTRKARLVSSRLCSKGFERNDDADHCQLILYVDGIKTRIRTKISHGEHDIGDSLILKMARQLKLDKHDFLELVDCNLSGEAYLRMMMDKGEVESAQNHADNKKE